jgi:hypothetical protein
MTGDERAAILAAIDQLEWRFAHTLAHIPHEHTTRSRRPGSEAAFDQLMAAIRQHGVPGEFQGFAYRYLRPGDGWQYWRMRTPVLINRAKVAP